MSQTLILSTGDTVANQTDKTDKTPDHVELSMLMDLSGNGSPQILPSPVQ